jgi:trimeric autotransporter adhesin
MTSGELYSAPAFSISHRPPQKTPQFEQFHPANQCFRPRFLTTTHFKQEGPMMTSISPRALAAALLLLATSGTALAAAGDENWDDRFGPPGINNTVMALAVSGSDLYVGGALLTVGGVTVTNIAKWNGQSWATLGSGVNGWVQAIAVSGSDVYVAGEFTKADGVSAIHVAKWNGSSWSALGSGIAGEVLAIGVTQSGDVYVGGSFTIADGAPANYIARWNGSSWSAVGDELSQGVKAIAVSGNDVYVGGWFQDAGALTVNNIAKWDGTSWSKLDSGVNGSVTTLAISNGNLYAGGQFTKASGATAKYIARWDGAAWSALGAGLDNECWELATSGSEVYAAGLFTTAGGASVNSIAKWNGSTWSALGTGMEDGGPGALAIRGADVYFGGHFTVVGGVRALNLARWNGSRWFAVGDGLNDVALAAAASGSEVYVGGMFTQAGGVPANHIAKWDGESWTALGSGLTDRVYAVAATGGVVYAGGDFTTPGNRIAKWNGSTWSALGSGVNSQALAIAISGNDVYVGGQFTAPGNHIAKWNGSSWSALGDGVNGPVQALAIIGPDLYAGGAFSSAGGNLAIGIAKWNGSNWSPVGGDLNNSVSALAVNGADLYASGWFTTPGNHIAKWNGTSWSALGDGLNYPALGMAATGNRLYAAGIFTNAGNYVAVWSGSNWSALGSGFDGWASTIAISGTNVYVGGYFEVAGRKPSAFIARWLASGICPTAINPASVTLGTGVTNATLAVTAASDCAWSATANAAWLHTGSSGAGNGTVEYSTEANAGPGFRAGTITVGEQTFTVHQAGTASTPPAAVCQNVVVVAGATCHAPVPASAVDNNSFDNDGTIVSRSLSPVGPYPKGVTGVTLTVTDNDGWTDSCGATITVEDHTPPAIACPGNLVTNLAAGVSNTVVSFSAPVVSDNCVTATVVCEPSSGTTFPLGTNPVVCAAIDASGNTNTCGFSVFVLQNPPAPHDLAVIKLKAPKKIALSATATSKVGKFRVSIQNNGPQTDTIADLISLVDLVTVSVQTLGTNCAGFAATFVPPKKSFPISIAPKKKLNLSFTANFNCANDPATTTRTTAHNDFKTVATIDLGVLGEVDTASSNNFCPRPPSGTDPGCGNKTPVGTLGADVLTDVVVKP